MRSKQLGSLLSREWMESHDLTPAVPYRVTRLALVGDARRNREFTFSEEYWVGFPLI